MIARWRAPARWNVASACAFEKLPASCTPQGAVGRTKGDAPEIDGAVYISSRRPLRQGEIVSVKIERADAYDLHGTAAGF